MRAIPILAAFSALFGAAYVQRTQAPPSSVRTPEPAVALDCARSRALPHAPDHTLPHLGHAALLSMDRVPIRAAGSVIELSGWRMDISSDHGAGTITSLDLPEGTCYAGGGVLAGWRSEDLAHAYVQLTPDESPVDVDFTQLLE